MSLLERLDILTTQDSGQWREALEQIGSFDCYHLPQYHELSEIAGDGEARLIVYRSNGYTLALPILLRTIDPDGTLGIDRSLRDATSVYGYPGPIASTKDLPEDAKTRFSEAIQDFFVSNNVICAFTRLNPLLGNAHVLAQYGETVEIGPTLSMDLTIPPEEQYGLLRRSHRHDIVRLEEMGVTCAEEGPAGLDDFLHVYYETMNRTHADRYFYFNLRYFQYLTGRMPELAHTFICRDESGPVSAMIALECNGVIQGHLGGAVDRCLHAAPMKYCYDQVRRWGNSLSAHTFHIGGGIGGQRDNLLFFKRGFGKREHVFSIWRHIVSPELYRRVCRQVCGADPNDGYFPAYRNPSICQISKPMQPLRERP